MSGHNSANETRPTISTWLTLFPTGHRFALALLIGVLLNLLAWTAGYYFLAEGALQGATLAGNLPIGEQGGPARIFLEIFLFNLLVAGGVTAVANIFRVGNLPLGYVYVWGNWVLFGLFLGTDSFTIAGRGRLAPSVLRLLQSKGFYEISAYTIIAAATVGFFLYRQRSWLDWYTEKVRSRRDIRLKWSETLALLLAILLLLGANLWEAVGIARLVG